MSFTSSSLMDATLSSRSMRKTSDVDSGPWSHYADNYLVQFDECHFLMGSLRDKSGNDVVQLTSKLIQNVISVTQAWWAPLGVSLQTDRVRDSGAGLPEGWSRWERSDPQKRVKTRQRQGQLQRSLLLSLSAHIAVNVSMLTKRLEELSC